MSDSLLEDIISTANAYAENFAEEGPFDFSLESLERVDEQLEDLSCFDLSEEALENAISMIGCYVFETARRNYGGQYFWFEQEQQPILVAGLPDFRVSICAWYKVRARLRNGSEDSIPFYIAGYRQQIERTSTQRLSNFSVMIT